MISPDRGECSCDPSDEAKRPLVTPEMALPCFHETYSLPRLDMARFRDLFDILEVPQDLLDRLPLPTTPNALHVTAPEFTTLDDMMTYLSVMDEMFQAIPVDCRKLAPRDALSLIQAEDPDLYESITSSLTLFLSRKVSRAIIEYSQGREQSEHFVLDAAIQSLATITEEAIDTIEAKMLHMDSNAEVGST